MVEAQVHTDLRQAIAAALEAGVEYVLAYVEDGKGRVAPRKVRTAEQAERAVFDRRCHQNLVTLLPKASTVGAAAATAKRYGIVAKACDVRSLVVLLQEEMVDRAAVQIIGVVCDGVEEAAVGASSADCQGKAAPRCAVCRDNVPELADVVVGDAAKRAKKTNDFAEVAAFEAKSPAERWQHWSAEFEKCRRCYACRSACPLCYCDECLIDRAKPQLVEGSVKPSSNLAFHLMRAYHLAGRCVDCGACQAACPEHLPLRILNQKMAREVKQMFDHEAGTNPDAKPPLVTLSHNDPDAILKGGMTGE